MESIRREIREIDDRRDVGYGGDWKLCKQDSRRRKVLIRRLSGEDDLWTITGGRRGAVPGSRKAEYDVLRAVRDLKTILKRKE
jgi:hypothetical protein